MRKMKNAQKSLVCVWDLDNTLGWKTPTYPAITKENIDFIRYLNGLGHVQSILATGRPRTQAKVGLNNGGMDSSQLYKIFRGGVFEDGLFVENEHGEIYNAMNEAKDGFKTLKKALFGRNATNYFGKHGYILIPGFQVRQNNIGSSGCSYTLLDYNQKTVSGFSLPKDMSVIYEQGNDVRGTYKAPIGFMNENVKAQGPFFDNVELLVRDLLKENGATIDNSGNIDDHSYLVRWEDAIELYPKLGGSAFRKDSGVEMLLEQIDPNKEALLVFGCDGKNDISLVDHLGEKYANNYLVIAPSNLSPQLKTKLDEHNALYGKKCYILDQDCTGFGVGVLEVLKNLKLV